MPRRLRSSIVDSEAGGTYLAQTRFVVVQELKLPLPGDPTPKPPAPEGWAMMTLAASLEEITHDRLRELVAHTSTSVLGVAIGTDRMHLVLRSRPDLARAWSDKQVLNRWLALHPKRRRNREPTAPSDREREAQLADTAELARRRDRLGDVSYFLKSLKQEIGFRLEPAGTRAPVRLRWDGVVRMQPVADLAAARREIPAVPLGPVLPGS